jgi:hypothetical protein
MTVRDSACEIAGVRNWQEPRPPKSKLAALLQASRRHHLFCDHNRARTFNRSAANPSVERTVRARESLAGRIPVDRIHPIRRG